MKRPAVVAALLLAAAAGPGPAWARGGGGCLEEGTSILTPSGPVAVERLTPGDEVLSVSGGAVRRATVQDVFRVDADDVLELTFAGGVLRITPEHPVACGPGLFRTASTLRPGDPLRAWDGTALREVPLLSVRRAPATRPAFNLLVHPGGTFVANGLAVHNKGCFLPDTPVLRADGSSCAVRDIRPGDVLLAFTPGGSSTGATVLRVMTHEVDAYLVVATERAILRVTEDHPFFTGNGTFRTMESLQPGDAVYAWDGAGLRAQRILAIERVRARTTVFNLQTDAPHTFFASGILVHNKGGGCFPAGTPVRTPGGDRTIESLAPGDVVTGVDGLGRASEARVLSVFRLRAPLVELDTETGPVRVTPDHPMAAGDGAFRAAGELDRGDALQAWRGGRLEPVRVLSRRTGAEAVDVFNLHVGPPHTFIASGFLAHNKGGSCLVPGTPVLTPRGEVPIESIAPGDVVVAYDGGTRVDTPVIATRVSVADILAVTTEAGTVLATTEHPFQLASGAFREAGTLRRGDALLAAGGEGLRPVRVRSVRREAGARLVVNLQVAPPHTFVAGGLLVHNKGGGFRSSSSRSGGSGRPMSPEELKIFLIVVGSVVLVVIVVVLAARKRNREEEDLDYVYSPSAVATKADKTRKLLDFIARTDTAWAPDELRKTAESTFRTLQRCWQARDYEPMRTLLMPDLFNQHLRQIEGMRRNHEINMIADLSVERIDLVNVRYTEREDRREFTALILAWARDYYVDDRSQKVLRGDDQRARFQEFWTFQRQGGAWRLREIEQTRESDALKDENFFEPFTDEKLKAIYGEPGKEGPAGPWLERDVAAKENRIERMLGFLVQTDRLWDRRLMIDRAREVFLDVLLSREAGDPGRVPAASLFPEVATSLADEMRRRREEGASIEYRNLCVRKVVLVLVRNFDDKRRDEFTARISAHAQIVIRRGGAVVRQDEYVRPFEEYWTFGRLENTWRLKETQPPADGARKIGEENLDQDSSPEQLQWYYRQPRAR